MASNNYSTLSVLVLAESAYFSEKLQLEFNNFYGHVYGILRYFGRSVFRIVHLKSFNEFNKKVLPWTVDKISMPVKAAIEISWFSCIRFSVPANFLWVTSLTTNNSWNWVHSRTALNFELHLISNFVNYRTRINENLHSTHHDLILKRHVHNPSSFREFYFENRSCRLLRPPGEVSSRAVSLDLAPGVVVDNVEVGVDHGQSWDVPLSHSTKQLSANGVCLTERQPQPGHALVVVGISFPLTVIPSDPDNLEPALLDLPHTSQDWGHFPAGGTPVSGEVQPDVLASQTVQGDSLSVLVVEGGLWEEALDPRVGEVLLREGGDQENREGDQQLHGSNDMSMVTERFFFCLYGFFI